MLCGTEVFQSDDFNRHRPITTIVLILYLVCKAGWYTFCIISTAQNILKTRTMLEWLLARVSTVMCYKNAYMWYLKRKLLNCSNVEVLMKVHSWWIHHDKLFSGIQFFSNNWIWGSLTYLTLFLFIKRASTMHSTTFYVLKDMKWYGGANIWIVLIWFWTWKIYPRILRTKKQKHSSNVVIHSLMMDMHTLLPSKCQILLETYVFHVVQQNIYMSQINNWPFHQTFSFVHYSFDI